ncbi:MAG: 3-hydroxyanthranilate 3,4-dioxygenase, partial [Lysobacteraceae bacterium]
DGLRWYCQRCNAIVYEEFFVQESIETQFQSVFERYRGDAGRRTC